MVPGSEASYSHSDWLGARLGSECGPKVVVAAESAAAPGVATCSKCSKCKKQESGGVKLLMCSRCKTAQYSQACQKGDWKSHKLRCKN